MPFGGINPFLHALKFGMFNTVAEPSFWFTCARRGLTYIYFVSLICGILMPLAYKINPLKKYKLEVVFGCITLTVLLLGGRTLMLIFG